MHELAITQSVVEAVVARVGDRPVRTVTLVIGRLSGVVADSVRFSFDLCTLGTSLQGARLEIVEPAGRGRCQACGDIEMRDLVPLCRCGAVVEIIGGQELAIDNVEVVA